MIDWAGFLRFLGLVLLILKITNTQTQSLGQKLERFEETQPHMGTLARIVVYAPDPDTAARGMRTAFARIGALNLIFSDYLPDSELSRLCQRAGGNPVTVSPDLLRILLDSQSLARQTDGAFDITAGPMIRLWRRARRQHELPTPERMAIALDLSGYSRLRLNAADSTAQLMKQGMQLDLGGIAKGYAADEALKSLTQVGIQRALIALGGDIAVSDAPPGKQGWTIDIATTGFPNQPKPKPLLLRYAGVSTAGDAEQYVEIDGVRYSHIIDPRTGQALTGRSSVTVTARTATESDGLDTAISVLGFDRGLKLVETIPGAAALMTQKTSAGVKTVQSKRWKTR